VSFEKAQNPLVAAILGGLVVLVAGLIAVAAGWVGKDETIVQRPLGPVAGESAATDNSGLTINEIYRRDGPGVVFIRAEFVERVQTPFDVFPQRRRNESTGAGFVVDEEGHVLTNSHVVQRATKIEVGFGEGRTAAAKLVGQDAGNDVALLKVDTSRRNLEPLELGDSSKAEVGDAVVAIGNPFGLDRTVTTGIVSALQRQIQAPNGFTIRDVIQTDAAINPGNSGGPLIDARGKVIGINSQIATAGGGGSIGIGFAVPINTAKKIAVDLKKSGKVEHAYLGITGFDVTPSLSERLNLRTNKGVLVQEVTGPAEKAGVQGGDVQATIGTRDVLLGGDVITEIDGKPVRSMDQVIAAVDSNEPGDEVELRVLRGSRSRVVKVELGDRPARVGASSGSDPQGEVPLPPELAP
jgi:S1-C subfamily serine protease